MTATLAESSRSAVAAEYAKALLDLGGEAGIAELLAEELAATAELIGRVEGLIEYLETPIVPRSQKLEAIDRALAGNASDLLRDFLCVLVSNGRGGLIAAVGEAYCEQLYRRTGRVSVHVTSAIALDEGQQSQLAEVLREVLGVKPVLKLRTDPDLIGGLRVRMGEKVIDASVRGELDELRQALARPRRGGNADR